MDILIYVCPGEGTIFWQALIGIGAGVVLFGKNFALSSLKWLQSVLKKKKP